MAIVKKISELTPKGSALALTDLLVVGVDNGSDYDLKSITGAQILGNVISQTITDGDTTHSPSSNVVFDSLALKVDKVVGSRLITSAESTLIGNTSGTNTGDQDLSGKVDKVVGKGLSTEDYTTTEKNKLAGLTGTNTGDQTLQTVTDKGNGTSNLIYVTNSPWQGILSSSTIKSSNVPNGTWTSIDGDGKIQIKTNAAATGIIKATNIANDVTLEIPNKTVGTYTIATTTDLTSKVDSNTAITGATKTKITYDSKGLVTSGADATTADIADSTNKRYVTDANLTVIGNTSGTNTGDQDLSTYQVYATATTGSVISFVIPQIYNSVASPSSLNITDSLTSAKIGIVQKIYHNHTVAPTFPAGWVKMGTATYTTSTLNVIFAEWVSSTRVEYWITKPS